MDRTHPHRIEQEEGQAMVELALVLPVLCTLLFAIVQFGITFNNYLTLTDAVRAGARQGGAVARYQSYPKTFTENKVIAAATGLTLASGLQVSATPSADWTSGSDVTVTASYPCTLNLLFVPLSCGRISSTTTERVE